MSNYLPLSRLSREESWCQNIEDLQNKMLKQVERNLFESTSGILYILYFTKDFERLFQEKSKISSKTHVMFLSF